MHVITLPGTVKRVDLDAAVITLVATWSTPGRAAEGLAADIISAKAVAPRLGRDGEPTGDDCVVADAVDTAGGAARRAKVCAELQVKAREAVEALKTTYPGEPWCSPQPPRAPSVAVKKPAGPPHIPTPTSNNDEIARAIVKKATYDAKELGQAAVEALNVSSSFDAYVAKHALGEKRAAGIKTKIAALGFTWQGRHDQDLPRLQPHGLHGRPVAFQDGAWRRLHDH